ncbi:methyltransferase domain-containing protein [Methanobrevibacter millerae]|uniref:Predicted RNA methylase n=1 Tax=Methanobrevibacter millerae TaxID=230361 RepID=A0A1G5XP42_9EURY|nr:methyltransferase domain-containing protein [Methanobrevibacter millerae]SDA71467.1 Predicted RNA methylase [Methanobrevibacter millerae]
MKFKATSYHFDLLKDNDRVSAFFEAINDYSGNNDLAYDLGCGSGVLSYFLSESFHKIIAVEIDSKAAECASDNLNEFENVTVINSDVLDCNFRQKADLIVCEMMDTALIDEEEVQVLNHARKALKNGGEIIPKAIVNFAELVNMERDYIHWDENAKYEILSNTVNYSKIDFKDEINPDFEKDIEFKANKTGNANGIKITTVTILNDNMVCGPTPMFNPPLLIPIDEIDVKCNDLINVKLKYIMGQGIETVSTQIM